jgi:hypothetical protein
MGIFLASLKVMCLSRILEPKVSASMSSVAVAKTFPDFTRAAHCASASQGAYYNFKMFKKLLLNISDFYVNVWNSHQFEELLTLFSVRLCHLHQSPVKFVHLLSIP